MVSARNSAIYVGHVRHERSTPIEHGFTFPLLMFYLDLSELPQLFDRFWFWSSRRFNLGWFKRDDYLAPEKSDLDSAVRDCVKKQTGRSVDGPIRLLAQIRSFGYCFNPVSIYYCFKPDGEHLDAVVCEITNTPWGERHRYVLDAADADMRADWLDFNFKKDFHVSPFMPMDMDYRWCFAPPDEQLRVFMQVARDKKAVLSASLHLKRRPIGSRTLAWALVRYPAMALQVHAMIYWQALRLWWKRAPFYSHPNRA